MEAERAMVKHGEYVRMRMDIYMDNKRWMDIVAHYFSMLYNGTRKTWQTKGKHWSWYLFVIIHPFWYAHLLSRRMGQRLTPWMCFFFNGAQHDSASCFLWFMVYGNCTPAGMDRAWTMLNSYDQHHINIGSISRIWGWHVWHVSHWRPRGKAIIRTSRWIHAGTILKLGQWSAAFHALRWWHDPYECKLGFMVILFAFGGFHSHGGTQK